MKIFLMVCLVLLASFSAANAQKPVAPVPVPNETPPVLRPEKIKKPKPIKQSHKERLESYFNGNEIEPYIIINNLDGKQTGIELADNKITWIRGEKEIKIKINDDLFSLEGKKTLNNVDGERKDDVDFADNWRQIKLYKFGDRELIGIKMHSDPCTGIGCRVAMYLIYDLKTKTKNFFGSYRFLFEREFGLFDFGNDGTLDFLSGTYDQGTDGKGIEFKNIYEIFTMDDAGVFRLQLDKNGKPYFMKRVYKEEDYREVDKKFESNWIEEIR